jgi:hypothetical protein
MYFDSFGYLRAGTKIFSVVPHALGSNKKLIFFSSISRFRLIMPSLWSQSISNNSLKQVAILITLVKTQNSFSNNSSNQLAIYPHLLFIGLVRGRIRARKGLAIPISGPRRRSGTASRLEPRGGAGRSEEDRRQCCCSSPARGGGAAAAGEAPGDERGPQL